MNRSIIHLIPLGLALFSSLVSAPAYQTSHSHLRTRASDTDNKSGSSKTCQTYYSANTPHAVCNGDRSIMCLGGCTGGVVAQNCRSNSSSTFTTQTCSVAFSQTSETSYLCNTPQGAYTCQGPQTGGIACRNCLSTPNDALSSNITTIPGNSSSNSTNEHDSQDLSSDSSGIAHLTSMAFPGLISLFATVAFLT